MAKFNRLTKLDVNASSLIKHTMEMIEGTPTLHLRPAGEANPDYFNGLLKLNGKSSKGRRQKKSKDASSEFTAKLREYDKELYPQFVIVGWDDMVDDKGKAVKFTIEDCIDFINCLPNWIFDTIRVDAAQPESFIDVEEISGN